jgi:hypothetical protein
VTRGRVLDISCDFGNWAVRTRYRQIANGRGLSFDALEGQLVTSVFPRVYLNDPNAERLFGERCQGFDLVIVDCLRDALPGLDENDSTIAAHMKALARISESLGCSFLYLHHLKKDGDSADIESARGSGAIAGASGSVYSIDGQGDAPRKVQHIRPHDASRGMVAPFYVTMVGWGEEEAAFDAGGRGAFRLVMRTTEQMEGVAFAAQVERNEQQGNRQVALLIDLVTSSPGLSQRAIRQRVKGTPLAMSSTDLAALLGDAVDRGFLVTLPGGKGGGLTYHPKDAR